MERAKKSFAYQIRGVDKRSIAASKFRIRPLPLADELLSSWLVRTAYMHHTDPTTFLNLNFPEHGRKLWERDLDLFCDGNLTKKLAEKTGFPEETIYRMTLKSYEGRLAQEIYPNNRNVFIIPTYRRSRNIRHHAQRMCPLCLKDDKQPYLRKKWRLFFSTACIKHNCFLIDKCPECGAPFMVNKRLYDEDFPHCRKCGFSFKAAEPEFIDSGSYGLKAIKTLYGILDGGIFIFENRPVYSFFFFDVLNHFTKFVKWGYRKNLPIDEIIHGDGEQLPVSDISRIPYVMELDIKQQFALFSGLMRLFESKENMLKFCADNNITVKKLSRSVKYVPFWFQEIYDTINKTRYSYTAQEIGNALIYLKKQGMNPTFKNLYKIFGISLTGNKREIIFKLSFLNKKSNYD
ncbi:MAG: TniQ family protein [bacterium]